MGRVTPLKVKIDNLGDEVNFIFISDTHIGSIYYHHEFMDEIARECDAEKYQFVVHAGDVTNGMDAHKYNLLYELVDIGYEAQKAVSIIELMKLPIPLYVIDGNHDRWYESNGAYIVKDICRGLTGATYLGRDEGDISINGITIKVFHGEDGSSYATSYRIQKLIESFTGGEKPNVLLVGHAHKQGYFFERNIHAVSGGALSTQSRWMRSKRLANHCGYHKIRMRINKAGVSEFTVTWRPFYV